MPAGPSVAPGAGPARLAGFGSLPEREVEGVALAVVDRDPLAGPHVFEFAVGELAVIGEAIDGVVDISVHGVGVGTGDEGLDEADDLRDGARNAGCDIWRDEAEQRGVGVERIDEPFGERRGVFSTLVGAPDDLVVDVGVVADKVDLPTTVPQVADHCVEGHEGAAMSDVGKVVHRDAADIEFDPPRLDGFKGPLGAGEGVEELEGVRGHGRVLCLCGGPVGCLPRRVRARQGRVGAGSAGCGRAADRDRQRLPKPCRGRPC